MILTNKNKEYKHDESFIYSCQYHVIICPKYRRKIFNTEEIRSRLRTILVEKTKEYGGEMIEVEVMVDHVHMLISVNPKFGIYRLVSKLKGVSANILRDEFPSLKSKLPCIWSGARFISTVGEVSLSTVQKYIEDQYNK